MNTDLTTGNTSRLLWAFSIPMLISVVFQQFFNIADSIIAGRFIGEQALAAVGASYPITMIFMAVAIGSSIGCTVVVSQLFGSKHYAMLKTAVTKKTANTMHKSVMQFCRFLTFAEIGIRLR